MILFEIGSKCLIDGKTEAVILKSFNKAQTKFIIEIPGTSVQIVERERISPIPAASVPVPAI
jgi:hypothetical protein